MSALADTGRTSRASRRAVCAGGEEAVAGGARRGAGAEGRGLSMRARTLALGGWMVQGGAMWSGSMSALAGATRCGGDGK